MTDQNKVPEPAKESAKDYEAHKTNEQRAEDVAYTINHALACTLTDFIDPYVGNWTQEYLGKRISIGCGHDHSQDGHGAGCDHKHVISLPQIGGDHDDHGHVHGPGCNHHTHSDGPVCIDPHAHDHPASAPLVHAGTHDHAHCPAVPKGNLKHWIIGEFVGDFGAVPVTIAFQRYAPNFMDTLRNAVEPVLGGAFRMGARFSARSWASENNMAPDSKAAKDKENEIYEHEVRHLPQAVVWTASSIALNLATQRYLGNNAPLGILAAAKATGATISAALVVTGRAFAPQSARRWDQYTSKNIFLPMTKVLGNYAGITSEDVDRMAAKEGLSESSWTDKVKHDQPTTGKTLG